MCHGVTCRRWDELRTVSCGAKFDVELIGLGSSVSMSWPKVVWWSAALVVVATVTATTVYLGHAIDFHVSCHLPRRSSRRKVKRSTVEIVSESFSENPPYIRYRIWCVQITALTCSIGIWRLPLVRGKGPIEQDLSVLPHTSPPSDILISDKEQTFTWCRWFAPILSLVPARGSFYHQRVAVFDYPLPKSKWEAAAYSTKGAARFFRQKIIADNKSQTAVIPCRSGTPFRGGWVAPSEKIQKGKERNNGSDGNVRDLEK